MVAHGQFAALVRPLYEQSGEALRRTFELFDADRSGYIDRAECRAMLSKLGLTRGKADAEAFMEKVFAAADVDGDGHVSYAEFVSLFAVANVRGDSATMAAADSSGAPATS
jgi:Ca2+-binding EF-hand superfamily protein